MTFVWVKLKFPMEGNIGNLKFEYDYKPASPHMRTTNIITTDFNPLNDDRNIKSASWRTAHIIDRAYSPLIYSGLQSTGLNPLL